MAVGRALTLAATVLVTCALVASCSSARNDTLPRDAAITPQPGLVVTLSGPITGPRLPGGRPVALKDAWVGPMVQVAGDPVRPVLYLAWHGGPPYRVGPDGIARPAVERELPDIDYSRMTVGADGSVYFADRVVHRVARWTPGKGSQIVLSATLPAPASPSHPIELEPVWASALSNGDIYIFEWTKVWKISGGNLQQVASLTGKLVPGQNPDWREIPEFSAISSTPDGGIVAVGKTIGVVRIAPDGEVTAQRFRYPIKRLHTPEGDLRSPAEAKDSPAGVAADRAGNIYAIVDSAVVRVSPDGETTTFIARGRSDGPVPSGVTTSFIEQARAIAYRGDGTLALMSDRIFGAGTG